MSWHLDLSYGKKREQEFINALPFLGFKALDGLEADFIDNDGNLWELKAERRSSLQTPNIAVEVESSFAKKGAIFNAVKNKCKFIAYYFSCGTIFIYDASNLLDVVRCYRRKYGSVRVRSSNAKVVLLPRKLIKRFEVKFG